MFCCFTGHRPEHLPWIADENSERCKELKNLLFTLTEQAVHDGYTDFYCGMARGIDTLAAEAVLALATENRSVRLHAVLPCPDQHTGWNDDDRKRYENILSFADSKTIISPMYTDTCMLTRNRYMVDNSQQLIAVWSGYFRGGTAYTVRYAKKEKKEIYLIRPKDLSVNIL